MALFRRWIVAAIVQTLALGIILLPQAAAHGDLGDTTSAGPSSSPAASRSKLVLVKIYCLLILFVVTFLAGVSPYFMKWSPSFLVLGVQFAGGVFMSTALLHFLGDSNTTFEELTSNEYPFAYMLAVCGYLLTMIGDQTIYQVHSNLEASSKLNAAESEPGGRTVSKDEGNDEGRQDPFKCLTGEARDVTDVEREDVEVRVCGKCHQLKCRSAGGRISNVEGDDEADLSSQSTLCKHTSCTVHQAPSKVAPTMRTGLGVGQANLADALLLVLALCFHSFFEGLAIGISTKTYDAWRNLWTVLLHKVLAAISMSIALLRIIPDRPLISVATYAFGFSIASPVGIALGIIVASITSGDIPKWTYAIAMGLASGVFVFVAINHLLNKGYVPPHKVVVDTPFYKTIAIIVGAGVIFLVMYFD